jgi:hypothetical protein
VDVSVGKETGEKLSEAKFLLADVRLATNQ